MKTNYDTYAAEFHPLMSLNDAEDLCDAVLADSTLTADEREQLVLLAHRRFYRDPDDAINAFLIWRAHHRPTDA